MVTKQIHLLQHIIAKTRYLKPVGIAVNTCVKQMYAKIDEIQFKQNNKQSYDKKLFNCRVVCTKINLNK